MTDSAPQYVKINRSFWNAQSDAYDEEHGSVLSDDRAMAWGLWRIPEAELRILGDVVGKDILELGCGAARWAIELARLGAIPPDRRPCAEMFAWSNAHGLANLLIDGPLRALPEDEREAMIAYVVDAGIAGICTGS